MNDEQALADAKQSISEMKLSPRITLPIKKLAADLACINESYETLVVDVLRKALEARLDKAFGTSVQDWQDVVIELQRIGESGARKWKEFESSRIQPEVQRQQRQVRDRLISHLLVRLSPRVRKMYEAIDSGDREHPRDRGLIVFDETIAELQTIVSLNEEAFHHYETEKSIPEFEGYRVKLRQRRGYLPQPREGIPIGRLIVGPVKYTTEHFMQVDRFIQEGMQKREALAKVFDRHFRDSGNHKLESFKKQYRVRHELLTIRREGLCEKVDKLIHEGRNTTDAIGIVFREEFGTDDNKQKFKMFKTAYKEHQRSIRQ